MSVIIVGAGIGGLTLALELHRRGIPCRVYEASAQLQPLGVGINVLPHAMRVLTDLELQPALLSRGVETREMCFYNRYGQHIWSEPRGRFADHPWPQISLTRGALQQVLLTAVLDRLGDDAVVYGHRFAFADQNFDRITAAFETGPEGRRLESVTGELLIGCDGVRSAVRRGLHPERDPLRYSGITMWRGISRWEPFLSGASMIYAGWLETGKVIAYPVSDERDWRGRQLINWLCEFYRPPRDPSGDWSRRGALEDFSHACDDMCFGWLDVPGLVRAAEAIYEYPMVDRDPLPYWSDGRQTLLGDAAHPMYPRGSNGAGQAILDARTLAEMLHEYADPQEALHRYDDARRPATTAVVEANRSDPPDAILREVYERTGDRPFERREDVITDAELRALSERYQRVAGFDRDTLRAQHTPPPV